MAATCSEKTEHTRQCIMAAAREAFATHGYAAASIHTIAAAAQVAKPVLYYHYGSKAGLFREVVSQTETELWQVLVTARQAAIEPPAQLREICAAVFAYGCEHPSRMALAIELSLADQGKLPDANFCRQITQRRLLLVQEIMEEGLRRGWFRREFTARQLMLGYVGMLHFHLVVFLTYPEHSLDRSAAELAVALFLQGAAANSTDDV